MRILILFFFFLYILYFVCCRSEKEEAISIKGSENISTELSKKQSEQEPTTEIISEENNKSPLAQERKNLPPIVQSIRVVAVSDDETNKGFRAIVEAKDPEQEEISFRYQWKLDGDEIIGADEEFISWQENFRKGSIISVEVVPFDGKDEGIWIAEGSFTISNSPPRIISIPESNAKAGKFTYAIKAEDPDGDPIEFTIKNAPVGMTIEPATSIINWVFDENNIGEYSVEIVATDAEGAKSSQKIDFTISKENLSEPKI